MSKWQRRPTPVHLWILFGLGLVVHYCLTGIWVIEPGESGVLQRFSRVIQVCPPGLHFTLPAPIDRMTLVNTSETKWIPVGYREGQIERSQSRAEEREWLTGDTNMVEIKAKLNYRIGDPVKYLFGVADMGSIPRRHAIRRIGERVITATLASMKIDDVFTGKLILQQRSREEIQREVDELGIGLIIESVDILDASPPSTLTAAFNDVASAKADSERQRLNAIGYARDLEPNTRREVDAILQDAHIYDNRVVNAARGATDRFLRLAEQVRLAPEVSRRRLWMEFVEEALRKPNVTVYAPGEKGQKVRLQQFRK